MKIKHEGITKAKIKLKCDFKVRAPNKLHRILTMKYSEMPDRKPLPVM